MKNAIGVVIAIGTMILIDRAIERRQRFARFTDESLAILADALKTIGHAEVERNNTEAKN